jgi:hypothetical protein
VYFTLWHHSQSDGNSVCWTSWCHNAIHCLGNRVYYLFCCNVNQSQQQCAVHFDKIMSFNLLGMIHAIHFETVLFSMSAAVCTIHFDIISCRLLTTMCCSIWHLKVIHSLSNNIRFFSGGFRGSCEIMGKTMEDRRDAEAECRLELGWRCRFAETAPAVFSGMTCSCERCSVLPFTCHLKISKTFVLFQMWNWSLTVS